MYLCELNISIITFRWVCFVAPTKSDEEMFNSQGCIQKIDFFFKTYKVVILYSIP